MAHCIKHWLFVKLIYRIVDNNGRVYEILGIIRAAILVQTHVPIGPPCHPMIEILKSGILLDDVLR